MIVLSEDQQHAADAVREFLDGDGQHFTLHGLAGTGKTTVLSQMARDMEISRLCAPTGKAASVLREKTGMPTSTLHRLLYQPNEVTDHRCREPGGKDCKCKPHLEWIPLHEKGELQGVPVFLDECSMVGEEIARDLLHAGARVVAVGDPGQLPPVKASAFFTTPDYTLTQIHRQAAESPIIRQAYAVRETGHYQDDGEDFRNVIVSEADLQWADMVLCWKNQTRQEINRYMREARSFDGFPKKGEPLVCLKNNYQYGIMNGETFTVAEDYSGRGDIHLVECAMPVSFPHFESLATDKPGFLATRFDFAYCLTVHKSQGSEWEKVLIVDENFRSDRKEWAYTAITRASKSIRICRV
jgi:exodeoxyribonuclease-5